MFQPQIVYDYRRPEDDSGDTYEKVSQEIVNYHSKVFMHICCLAFICFVNVVLSLTLKYHKKFGPVALFHFISYVIWFISFISMFNQNRSSRLPRKEKERQDRERQL
ncbi:hypothetical protein SPOG_05766 [Schizosaccharomyces cryophilus OY26]|uniref:Uncharacterized protein n=1 Tax=Schizosaccharomyces cryophilus (strain OY26 / ATCC MYA-4695 / CBS 11777 / NBRC 106824 / NRRL Y48691) TaxID=653667 RepID=S9VP85_SCHCR|nr:uncharacterized protein SPOG_05766 [Schizosaccharomyces cryophilus OY26]EPY49798.1 hypothetical protein SPOG_05766 [Schizosaccharomyces cryophilus OY26]